MIRFVKSNSAPKLQSIIINYILQIHSLIFTPNTIVSKKFRQRKSTLLEVHMQAISVQQYSIMSKCLMFSIYDAWSGFPQKLIIPKCTRFQICLAFEPKTWVNINAFLSFPRELINSGCNY